MGDQSVHVRCNICEAETDLAYATTDDLARLLFDWHQCRKWRPPIVRDDVTPAPEGWHIDRQTGTEYRWWICDGCDHPAACHTEQGCTGRCPCGALFPFDGWDWKPPSEEQDRGSDT